LEEELKALGVPRENIKVVSIPAAISSVTSQERSFDEWIFLSVGRLVKVKRVDLQIEAFDTFFREYKNSKLIILGEGPLESDLKKKVSEKGLEEHVIFGGFQDPKPFYEKAHALLLTSDREGWGMVAIEALSCGVPVIMTDVGCAKEVVKTGINGIVVPVGEAELIYRSMKEFAENRDLYISIQKNTQNSIRGLPAKEIILDTIKMNWQAIAKNHKK
jgi:glycosyltransferase involved in cell wall biosynthesis